MPIDPGRFQDPLVVSGSAHPSLAAAVASELRTSLVGCLLQRFPDGEQHVEILENVRGRSVFVVQSLGAPVGERVLELLLIADACHRHGAGPVSAILPYVAYARQDRVGKEGQPLAAKVLGRVLGTASFSQVLAVDLHSVVVVSCLDAPVAHLTAVPWILDALRPWSGDDAVVVSPDLGAMKLAESYARPLGLPLAVVHKVRLSGTQVAVRNVVGDVRDRRPILVDDMISTGATIHAAVDALLSEGCAPEITVAATHGVFSGDSADRLSRPEIVRTIVTDSLPLAPRVPPRLQVVTLAPALAEAVRRISTGRGLEQLLAAR